MNFPEDNQNEQYPRYVWALLAARRAQMIRAGEPPLVQPKSDNPLTIALEEIAAGKVRPRILSPSEVAVEVVKPTLQMLGGTVDADQAEADLRQEVAEVAPDVLPRTPFALAEVSDEALGDEEGGEPEAPPTLEDLFGADIAGDSGSEEDVSSLLEEMVVGEDEEEPVLDSP